MSLKHSVFFAVPPLISNIIGSFEITDIRDLVSITTGAVVTIPRGVAVRIKCIATGVPSPNITWYRRGENSKEKSLLVPNENTKIMKDYSLQIAHTLVVDAAYYTCVATNIAGQDEGTTHLNIGSKKIQFRTYCLYCVKGFRCFMSSQRHTDFLAVSRYYNLVMFATRMLFHK